MINVLHINPSDTHGGRFSGFEMISKGKPYGINAEMLVWDKFSSSQSVHYVPPSNVFLRFLVKFTSKIANRIGFDGLFNFSAISILFTKQFKRADIIHLHLIHNFCNFSLLILPFISIFKPVVWTFHDCWAFTGGCEHPEECDKWRTGCFPLCPHPRSLTVTSYFNQFLHYFVKKCIYKISKFNIVVASNWMRERVKNSPIVGTKDLVVIPFGLNLNLFKPVSKQTARKLYSIPDDYKVLITRDVSFNSKYKGVDYLVAALNLLDPNLKICIITIDSGNALMAFSDRFLVKPLGWIDGDQLVNALSAADLLIMPSLQESFGMLAVESMACGTPVVCFSGTALTNVTDGESSGTTIVESINANALATNIKRLLLNESELSRFSKLARIHASSNYSDVKYLSAHANLYKSLL